MQRMDNTATTSDDFMRHTGNGQRYYKTARAAHKLSQSVTLIVEEFTTAHSYSRDENISTSNERGEILYVAFHFGIFSLVREQPYGSRSKNKRQLDRKTLRNCKNSIRKL